MQNWFQSLLRPFYVQLGRKKRGSNGNRTRSYYSPALEYLEDRTVPSTFSSIASNFNGTAIPAGDSIWFNAAFKASGLGAGPVSMQITGQTISFNSGGTAYTVNVPDSILNFSPANTVATTSFDAAQNAWVSNLPMSWSGNAFLGGASFVAPAGGLPGGINPVTWSGNFSTDTDVSLKWQWGAAVYTTFNTGYNDLNVKPLDSNSATTYHNSDHAGTPEDFKSFVVGGGRGGGGSNWTGSYSGTASVIEKPLSISGHVYVTGTDLPLAGVTITLNGFANGVAVNLTAVTDAMGYYQFFSVAPGSYSLTDSPVGDYVPDSATAGTGANNDGNGGVDQISGISLVAGDIGINFDFYEIAPVIPPNT